MCPSLTSPLESKSRQRIAPRGSVGFRGLDAVPRDTYELTGEDRRAMSIEQ
jgi:hypothetical protein